MNLVLISFFLTQKLQTDLQSTQLVEFKSRFGVSLLIGTDRVRHRRLGGWMRRPQHDDWAAESGQGPAQALVS